MLMTPFGQINLSPLFGDFNATQPIDPSAAFTGLTDAAGTSASSLGDLFSLQYLIPDALALALALTCPNRCHDSCAVFGELHWASAFGADEKFGAEFAFDAVDLVDQPELI